MTSRHRCRGTGLQRVAMELAMDMAVGSHEPEVVVHLPRVFNVTADVLSRRFQPGGISVSCRQSSRVPRIPQFQTRGPELWNCAE